MLLLSWQFSCAMPKLTLRSIIHRLLSTVRQWVVCMWEPKHVFCFVYSIFTISKYFTGVCVVRGILWTFSFLLLLFVLQNALHTAVNVCAWAWQQLNIVYMHFTLFACIYFSENYNSLFCWPFDESTAVVVEKKENK